MNRIYRLKRSSRTNDLIPVPEYARSRSRGLRHAALAMLISGTTGWSGLSAAADIRVHSGNTQVFEAPNGVQVIDIATTNGAGVSHNRYTHYNVDQRGLVLNNNAPHTQAGPLQSQLAGQVVANINLSREANLILNEVVAPNRSHLRGYTEVLGRTADVVVANPWGITCSGCGFINTDRVTLSTGVPQFGADGSLQGFRVNQGDILINGDGFDARDQNILDLVARSVKLDGQLNGQDVQIVTGSNDFNYTTRQATARTPDGAAPEYAIDSTALGGMYANRIRLIATEQGVGVRMLGEAAATADDFTLTAAGKITLRGSISAERDLAVTYAGDASGGADALALIGGDAQLSAKRDIDLSTDKGAGTTLSDAKLNAGRNLDIDTGSLSDTASADNTRFAGENLQLTVSGATGLDGSSWGAGDTLRVTTSDLSVGTSGATLYSGSDADAIDRSLALIATSGSIDLANAAVTAVGTLNIHADQGSIATGAQGRVQAGDTMSLTAADVVSNAADLIAGAELNLSASDGQASLTNSGRIEAAQAMQLGSTGQRLDIDNGADGVIVADSLAITARDLGNAGDVQASQGTTVQADSFRNTGADARFITATENAGDGVLTISGLVDNQGFVESAGGLSVNSSATLDNSGTIKAGGSADSLTLSATHISNSGFIDGAGSTTLTATAGSGTTFSNSRQIASAGALAISTGGNLSNTGTARIIGQDSVSVTSYQPLFTLDNAGRLQAGGSLTLGGTSHLLALNNQASGVVYAGGALNLTGDHLNNQGQIGAAQASTLQVASLDNGSASNAAALIQGATAGGASTLTVSGTLNNHGAIDSGRQLDLSTGGDLNNHGQLLAGDDGNLDVNGGMSNTGTVHAGAQLNLDINNGLNNQGRIGSVGSALLQAASLVNGAVGSADALIQGATAGGSRTSTLTVDGALNNYGAIDSGAHLVLGTGGDLDNRGKLLATASSTVTVNGAMSNESILHAGNELNLTVGNALNNQGRIVAGKGAQLQVASLVNGGIGNTDAVIVSATTSGDSRLDVTGSLDNHGAIHAGGRLDLAAAGIHNRNTGGLSSLTILALEALGAGDIDNYGALYAGNALNLTASGDDITNRVGTGTMDSGGTITSSSATFSNYNAVVANGDITITTSDRFVNETAAGVSKALGGLTDVHNHNDHKIANEGGADKGMNAWQHEEDYWRREHLVGMTEAELSALPKAQIIATGAGSSLNINYGDSGLNQIAVLSAPTVNISGSGTFTNQDLALLDFEYRRRWIEISDESIGKDDFAAWARTDPDRNGYSGNPDDDGENWDSWDPGSGWSWVGHEDADNKPGWIADKARDMAVDGAVRIGAATVKRFGAGIYAGTFNFSGGTLDNKSSPYPDSPNHALAGSAQGGSSNATSANGGTPGSVGSVTPGSGGSVSTAGTLPVASAGVLPFAGVNLTLPTNPNGYFVMARDPSANYLVETNPLFLVGQNFVGSDYLARRYGINPDHVQKRLGDANYEAYLIRQQLIQQTGSNVLRGYGDEASQMQRLMDQAYAQGDSLGLEFGKPLSEAQIANLTQDIVWMEEVVVDGQRVLAPRVYLADNTREMIAGGATISADNVNIAGEGLNNTGGTIEGSDSLTVSTSGDITNTSGTLKGGDVSLESTEGSIVNETLAEGAGDDTSYATTIGKTGGIEASGDLDMSAGEDIKVVGAEVSAGGNANLQADGDISFDTIVDKTTRTTGEESERIGGDSWSTTTTSTETNIGSNLNVGGNLSLDSGGDTTIAGSTAEVGGDLDVETGGDFEVIARQDKVTTHTEERTSGVGVGGGVYGTQTKTTDDFQGTNMGSTFSVGGNADIRSEGEMTLQGSDMNIAGNADIDAKEGINVLDGLDERRTTTRTETTTFGKIGGSSDSGSGSESASESGSGSGYAQANASAGSNAEAEASGDVKVWEKTVTTTESGSNTSVASNLNVGGNLNATTEGTLKVQGSNVETGGDMNLDAEDVQVLAGRNEEWSNTETTRTSVGIYNDSSASAEAGAGANANAGTVGTNADAEAGASAEADHVTTIGARTEQENSSSYSLKNTGSSLKSGGNMSIKAENTAEFEGAEVESGGDMDVSAENIVNRAAQDVEYSSSSSTTQTMGVYVGADASAEANASGEAGKMRLGEHDAGEAGASAEGNVSTGLRYNREQESSVEGSVTNQTTSFKAGGNITRTAEDTITDQGTQIEAGGNITQSAREIREEEVRDTSFSSASASSHDARLGVGASASAEAGGNTGGEAEGDAGAGAGFRASYSGSFSDESESESTAVTTRYKAGGNINSSSEEKTTLVGTQMEAGGDVNLEAGELEFRAAEDTSSSGATTHDVSADLKVDVVGEAGGSLDASYEMGSEGERSSTARTGSITSGGNLNIKTGGDASFEGTELSAGDGASIDAGGDVEFKAARDTTETNSSNANAELSLSSQKGGDKAIGVGGGYGEEDSESSTARVGGIKAGAGGIDIKSGGDADFEGTELESGGDTSIAAGGDVNLRAAEDTETSSGFAVSAEFGGESGDEGSEKSFGAAASANAAEKIESNTTSIESKGKVTISGKDVVNQEASIQGDEGTQIDGNEIKIGTRDRDTAVGVDVGVAGSSETKKPGGDAKTGDNPSSSSPPAADKDKPRAKTTDDLPSGGKDDKPLSQADKDKIKQDLLGSKQKLDERAAAKTKAKTD